MKYVLLFCGTREGQRAYDDMAPDELRAQLAEVGCWFADHGSRIVEGNQLQAPETRSWPGGGSVELRPVVTR
jgi:hypothetical protein